MASRSYTTSGEIGKASQYRTVDLEYGGKQPDAEPLSAAPTIPDVISRCMVQTSSPKKVQPSKPTMSAATKRNVVEYSQDISKEDDKAAATANVQDDISGIIVPKAKRARMRKGDEPEEKRLKRYRTKPPGTYLERLLRVRTQRMFLIDRERTTSEDGSSEREVFDIAGSTGNVYQVTISKLPACTCPDSLKGNQCKHIIYVMVNVLKAREDLAYQSALLSTELTEIFTNAPVTPQSSESACSTSTDTGGIRKPLEGDCPVCVMEFQVADDVIWCKAACGNNIHRDCFEQWAKSKPGVAKCVYCRSHWKGDEDSVKRIAKSGLGEMNEEGYVNVAGELGISTERDTSTYHPYRANRPYGRRYDRYWDHDDD